VISVQNPDGGTSVVLNNTSVAMGAQPLNGLRVSQISGQLFVDVVNGSSFTNNPGGEAAVKVSAAGTATIVLNVSNSTFDDQLFGVIGQASGTSTLTAALVNNTFTQAGTGIEFENVDSGNLNFDLSANSLTNFAPTGFRAVSLEVGAATGLFQGYIRNANLIDGTGVNGQGAVQVTFANDAPLILSMTANTIQDWDNGGLLASVGGASNYDVTFANNAVNGVQNFAGFQMNVGGANAVGCLNAQGNSLNGLGGGFSVQQGGTGTFLMERLVGATATDAENHLAAENSATTGSIQASGTFTAVAAGTCATPGPF
jgi:hypothetical protein